MKIYDQHVHTFLSSDSQESFEKYVQRAQELGLSHFVTTEHLDLSCVFLGMDDMPDLALQRQTIQEMQSKYDMQILKGIELGYKFSRLQDIENIVDKENFDVIIMSVHESEDENLARGNSTHSKSSDAAYAAYLDLYIHMLENCSCYDIVGHIDFLLRYIDPVVIEKHKEKLCTVLTLVMEKEKALEFNTKNIYQVNNSGYLNYIFSLYYKLGGRKISLGSDAHTVNNYMRAFEQSIDMLKNIGFTHACTFQKREETKLPLSV